MKPLSVNDLAALCSTLQQRGFGEYIVKVSDDEECNDYHLLWSKKPYVGEPIEYIHGKERLKSPTILIS